MSTDEMTALEPALEAELERLRATEVGRQITAIEVLLGKTDAALRLPVDGDRGGPSAAPPPTGRRGPGVSETILTAVRQYMEKAGEARQVEVARDLELNSGSASLALRWLASQGDIQDTGRVQAKSKVWKWIGEPSAPPKPGSGGSSRINLGTAGRTSPGDRDAKRIAESLRYTSEGS